MNRIIALFIILGLAPGIVAAQTTAPRRNRDLQSAARSFLDRYQARLAELEVVANKASWAAANSGKKEDFDAYAETVLAMKKFHSDASAYRKIRALRKAATTAKAELSPLDARALQVAELAFKENQLPPELLGAMVDLSTDIERTFNTFRAEIDGKRVSNNDLLEMIGKETDSNRRRAIWEALKQVGSAAGPKLLRLAKLRNRAAKQLGYANYWEMQIRLQEHDPQQLLAIFAELDRLTDEPFGKIKQRLDEELSQRFRVEPEQMMPWHYDNPFFQAAPPSEKVDLDEFYEDKTKEDIVELARKFFDDVGLPIDDVIARSDLYEREGKDQHAFCVSIDRADDVRTLCNIKPTAEWMDTMLHEQGHAVYDVGIARSLPYNLRCPSHAFTTEAVAMLFGALGKNPAWMIGYAGADEKRLGEVADAVLEQRLREQLIFARWTMVMLHFEKALYEDPDRDLNRLWWDYVERYQRLRRPPSRDEPDWAAKPHFTIAPVYYHNYMLGELFAAQLRHVLADRVGHQGPAATLSFNGRKQFGKFLAEKVFKPGNSMPWPKLVRHVTGEPLTARYFAREVR